MSREDEEELERFLIPGEIPLTLRAHRLVRHRCDESPDGVLRVVWLLLPVALLNRNPLLLRTDLVHRLHQLPFSHEHIILCHSVDEVVHVGEGEIHRTKARKQGDHGDTDNTDPRDSLFDGEDSPVDAEQRERITDAPEAVEIAEPEEDRQTGRVSVGNCKGNQRNHSICLLNVSLAYRSECWR
jgi:hypothetical protein